MPAARSPILIVAFGGNALIRSDEDGTQKQQYRRALDLAAGILPLVRTGAGLLLIHGNGPQVGQILIQAEEASTRVPSQSLDVCVAQSEGSIAYLLERALRTVLGRAGLARPVSSIITHVRVSRADAALRAPSKPIGPFYTRFRARALRRQLRWPMVEDAGRGYRRVVPSPRPVEVLQLETIRALLDRGHLVIAAGGGGIPVARSAGGEWSGVEAVIDKDLTAGLLAAELHAGKLIMLTDVDQVYLDYGKPQQRPVSSMGLQDARRYLRAGQFPPGSMGPKVKACLQYMERVRGEAIITSVRGLPRALQGRGGTRFVPAPGRAHRRRSA